MGSAKDPLLANLNAFKNKVKSSSNLAKQQTVIIDDVEEDVKPTLKRSASQMDDSDTAMSSVSASAKKEDDVIILDDIKRETVQTPIPIEDEHLNKNIKLEKTNGIANGLSSASNDLLDDIVDDEDSPSKKVRPGSLAAAALQSSQSDISRSHDSSKLLWATEYIQKKGQPVLLNELCDYLSISKKDKIVELLKKLEKIQFDDKTNSYKYISTYDVHSTQELMHLLRSQVTFKGISCRELKDGWPGCDEAINELEEESKILVLRTKKDRTPRYVWYNNGSLLNNIDEEFVKMWENVQLPQFSELPRKLQDLGLKPASVDPATIKRQTTKVEVKRKKQRRGKITNTHMAGILKDYSNRV
ncbi:hypothetical protein TPHA_0A04600 [Tetrapisispora phaffii CBS 4417]|uniref:TFIIE beta domain-containing protein n=1 Tax=Tetrapisispora phaffii (strain ATCC 24235 / CBS 4417 / NBRC 1672 / NRRL Y-8282 / UCD 70-5) TaxID=1071381 RepID=G8BNQ5_TETPH|nr:hypothetical protein TPHA_0A04600 [Tetrapisispora phaffii CBS 4417]CCE61533.1 hypothetical protein TPHA_0A04600 [Tetrapisispora phaffii CBS 4417]